MAVPGGAPETPTRALTRRTFIADLGRGAFALALIAVSGCVPATEGGAQRSARSSPSPVPGPSGSPARSEAPASAWSRVHLGHVSAYIHVRHGEAAIIDTGDPGDADEVGYALGAVGLGWSSVGHLILTHRHSDHVGSAADILDRAVGAQAHAGAEDIPAIALPRPLIAVADGDRILDLTIVTTPGHTPGSISVFDPVGSVLVAGDALATEAGRPIMPSVRSLSDREPARASVAKLAGMTFETLLVGHGDPIEADASTKVARLLATG